MDPSELQQSPGSMHVSDLDTPPHALPRRPHKLEPLTSTVQPLHGDGSGGEGERGEEKVKKKKKTKKKKRQAEVEEETRGDLDGREGTPVREEGEDPLLGASTLQQMQARLDPLLPTSNIPPHSDEHPIATVLSNTSESIPTSRLQLESDATEGEVRGEEREDGEPSERRRKRKKKRTHRESSSERDDHQAMSQEQSETPLADVHPRQQSPLPNIPPAANNRVTGAVPQYFPPAEEIQDEGEQREGERVVEGASPPLLSHTVNHSSTDMVFVERTDGRGFDIRHRKASSVVPVDDDTQCLRVVDQSISSELTALYSHQLVQKIAVIAHGLLAGLSLWDCIVSNVIGSLPGRYLTLLQSYHLLSLPTHSLYILLLSLVSLSLFDRLDVARVSKRWRLSLSLLALVTGSIVTVVAFIVSLSLAGTDDRVSLFPNQPSLWPDIVSPHNLTNSTPPLLTTHTVSSDLVYVPTTSDPTTSSLRVWLGMSVLRCLCCLLGWVLVILTSHYDRTEDYITGMLEKSVKQQQEEGVGRPSGCSHPISTTNSTPHHRDPTLIQPSTVSPPPSS